MDYLRNSGAAINVYKLIITHTFNNLMNWVSRVICKNLLIKLSKIQINIGWEFLLILRKKNNQIDVFILTFVLKI
jgi:hypothetical protein